MERGPVGKVVDAVADGRGAGKNRSNSKNHGWDVRHGDCYSTGPDAIITHPKKKNMKRRRGRGF